MKTPLFLRLFPLIVPLIGNVLAEAPLPQPRPKQVMRAVVDMTDGSRIVGTPLEEALPMNLSYANPTVPLNVVTRCEIKHSPEGAALFLRNGDHISGTLGVDSFPMETILGKLSPPFTRIEKIELSLRSTGSLTVGNGEISFGGVNWQGWRTRFEQKDGRLVSLPEAREGFNYGHGGNGRGAELITNIGEKDWTDYRIEVDFCMTGINPAFNMHGLGQDFRSGGIMFHVVSKSESWNVAPGTTGYNLSLGADGSWSIDCIYDSYCKTESGFGNPYNAGQRNLVKGSGLKLDFVEGNRFRIDVVGKRITVWMDGEQIADIRDEKMDEMVDGKNLTFGGVSIGWGFESMGWIENFSASRL